MGVGALPAATFTLLWQVAFWVPSAPTPKPPTRTPHTTSHTQSTPNYAEATQWLATHPLESHPNAQPWNGGLSAPQFEWLRSEIAAAAAAGERVVAACHHPLVTGAAPAHYLCWDHEGVRAAFEERPGVVALTVGAPLRFGLGRGPCLVPRAGGVLWRCRLGSLLGAWCVCRCLQVDWETWSQPTTPNRPWPTHLCIWYTRTNPPTHHPPTPPPHPALRPLPPGRRRHRQRGPLCHVGGALRGRPPLQRLWLCGGARRQGRHQGGGGGDLQEPVAGGAVSGVGGGGGGGVRVRCWGGCGRCGCGVSSGGWWALGVRSAPHLFLLAPCHSLRAL